MTTAQAVKVLEWAQRRLKLQDWTLCLAFADAAPDWLGEVPCDQQGGAQIECETKTARIWVSPSRSAGNVANTIIHEALEVFWDDSGLPNTNDNDRSHAAVYTLAAALADAYANEPRRAK